MRRERLVTSTDYDRPFRRLPVRLLDAVGSRIPSALPALELEAVLAAARRKAKLDDFGDMWFTRPLEVLLVSMRDEARLTPLGHLIQHGRIVSALVTRLRAQALLRERPEIREERFGRILVIAGLQRTGTTTLHRLLAADPRARALRSWEALEPVPAPGEEDGPAARQRRARMAERGLAYLAPEFFAVHPVEHMAPEEDVLLLDLSFSSQAPEATLRVPTYAAWLESQDQTKTYEELRTMLQVLQWQRGGEHWVLKTPNHMEHLDVLLQVFPEAFVIQTHRDPRKTMGSFCSMVAHARGVFSDHVDTHEIAEHWVRKVRRLMERSIAVRERVGEDRFVDVAYADLVTDPVAQVRRIYSAAGLPWDTAVAEALEAVRARDTQHRYGRHVYRLADFGLDDASIERELGFYRERYAIPCEGGPSSREAMAPVARRRAGMGNPLSATVTGILDLVRSQPGTVLEPLLDDERLDGQLCLITGASSGLGKATALGLARRGARLILACRSGIPEVGREIAERSGNAAVEMLQVDLADLDSVRHLCDQLRERGEPLQRVILNAGLMPRRARKTAQGFEIMFGVHFLANRLLIDRLLADGVLVAGRREGDGVPRIVFVSSESHKGSPPIDFDRFGEFVDYGITDGMKWYGSSKLHMSTFAEELGRRLNPRGEPVRVGVHHLCPGPVASNIGREAPGPVRMLLRPLMRLAFRSPERAAAPVVWLACARAVEGRTGVYLHMMREKEPSPLARDPEAGRQLWEHSADLVRERR